MTGLPDLATLQAHALAFCTSHGDPGAADRLVLLEQESGRITFSALDSAVSGSSISGLLQERHAIETIDRVLLRTLRMRRRERALEESGESGSPAWSIDVHVTFRAILINSGVNPLLLASCIEDERIRPVSVLAQAMVVAGLSATDFQLRSGRLDPSTLTIRQGDVDDVLVLYTASMGGETGLILRGKSMPESMMTAAVGRRLDEIVTHPLLEGVGHVRVTHVLDSLNSLTIVLDEDRTTLAPSPVGTSWMELPWNP